ncbi:unnamed protein product, partial [Rotaria sp. Silwood1]
MLCLVMQLNILLGKKIRWLEGSTDYWDVATYFELHAVQQEWKKACQAALQMYLLNPSSWRFKTTMNNLKIVHDARLTLNKQKSSKQLSSKTTSEDGVYNFWIEFFNDAINSDLKSLGNKELPAQLPILVRDNYERVDGTGFMNMYVEGRLQLNFHTGTDTQTLVIRLLEQHKHIPDHDHVKTIEMNLIKSIVEIKITDFGTSIHLVGLRRGSDTIGTPQYISPDMVNISPTGYGPEVDIWSIGCTVLEMATGEKPYHE